MATDTSGNQAVDFVWGNVPMHPNTVRADSATVSQIGGGSGDYSWSPTTKVASTRLDAALDNHVIVEAGWAGYPDYTPGVANYLVTAASGNGTTVTYTTQNNLSAGDVVTVTGLTASAYNLSSATVASANATKFTVTNSANVGEVTGQRGRVELSNALNLGDGAGVGNIIVPNVLGLTTALAIDALRDAGYEAANITTASARANARTNITRFTGVTSSIAVIYATNVHVNYPIGTKVTLVAGTPAGESPVNLPAYALGTWTVTGSNGAGQISVSGSGFTVADTTGINATGTLGGTNGTIYTQSTSPGSSGSVSTNATITITPWANAS